MELEWEFVSFMHTIFTPFYIDSRTLFSRVLPGAMATVYAATQSLHSKYKMKWKCSGTGIAMPPKNRTHCTWTNEVRVKKAFGIRPCPYAMNFLRLSTCSEIKNQVELEEFAIWRKKEKKIGYLAANTMNSKGKDVLD